MKYFFFIVRQLFYNISVKFGQYSNSAKYKYDLQITYDRE